MHSLRVGVFSEHYWVSSSTSHKWVRTFGQVRWVSTNEPCALSTDGVGLEQTFACQGVSGQPNLKLHY